MWTCDLNTVAELSSNSEYPTHALGAFIPSEPDNMLRTPIYIYIYMYILNAFLEAKLRLTYLTAFLRA